MSQAVLHVSRAPYLVIMLSRDPCSVSDRDRGSVFRSSINAKLCGTDCIDQDRGPAFQNEEDYPNPASGRTRPVRCTASGADCDCSRVTQVGSH